LWVVLRARDNEETDSRSNRSNGDDDHERMAPKRAHSSGRIGVVARGSTPIRAPVACGAESLPFSP